MAPIPVLLTDHGRQILSKQPKGNHLPPDFPPGAILPRPENKGIADANAPDGHTTNTVPNLRQKLEAKAVFRRHGRI